VSASAAPGALSPEFDFPSPNGFACPYPLYAELRATEPVKKLPGREEYLVTGRDEILWITRHPELFSSRHSVFDDGRMRAGTLADLGPDRPAGIGRCDPPQHAPKRKLAFELFKPGRLRAYDEMIQGHVDGLIDAFIARGSCEFVAEFADPLPVKVILSLFGLPAEDHERAYAWGRYEGAGSRFAPPERQESARQSMLGLGAYMREAIVARYEEPRDDELSRFVHAHVEHYGELDLPNIVPDATTLMIGGIFTTTHLISNMMQLFLANPSQLALVREDHALLGRATEEALRAEAPVQWSPRLASTDVEVGGVKIPAGAMLILVWASVNHDDALFADGDRFDVMRPNVKDHLSFGHGLHYCLGAPLARMEARIGFERLFDRVGSLRLAPGFEPEYLEAPLFRGPKSLQIEFDPVPASNEE
jgi:cytochrome P450